VIVNLGTIKINYLIEILNTHTSVLRVHQESAPNDHVHRARDVPRPKIIKPISRAPVDAIVRRGAGT
jgi:hypothetical protein